MSNLYCYENVLFDERQIKKTKLSIEDIDYIYAEPFVFDIGTQRLVIINGEMSQGEIVQKDKGLLVSKALIKDYIVIETLFNVLSDTGV